MKPLQLKISGINSFIEEQVIDFSQLTELGLFGIFGPTGSGKSTILDAITLALYGEIPRSGKDLSGAINSQGNQGDVYYEFEIGSQQDKRSYFVSRSFKRDAQGGVRTQGVKLCDITDVEEPIVLEEKVNAVNNAVADIIGLKCNDFTRSVVLPQGNFSDFLKLSGTEKRDMLERIFALQEYGTQLNIKIKTHKKIVQEEYSFIEGTLKAYEGVSQEALEELVKERKLLQEEFTTATEKFKKIDQDFEDKKNLYALTKEYKEYEKKNKELKIQEESMQDKKKHYDLAEKAKNIQPSIERKEKLEEKLKNMQASFAKNKKELDQVMDVSKDTKEKYTIQEQKKEKKVPQLVALKGKMEIAVVKKEKREKLWTDKKALEKQDSLYQEQLKTGASNLESSGQQLLEITRKIKEGQEKIEKLYISSQYRQKLYQAQGLEDQYKKTQEENQQRAMKIAKITEELKPLEEQIKQLEEKVKELENHLVQWEEEYKKTSQELEDIQHRNMAAVLAKDLEDGKSCPVCGSIEHPQKMIFHKEEKVEQLMQAKEELQEKMQEAQRQNKEKSKELQNLQNKRTLKKGFLQEWQEEYEKISKLLLEEKSRKETFKKELDIEDIERAMQDLQEKDRELEQVNMSIGVQQKEKEKLEEKRSKDQEDFNNKNNEKIKIQQSQEEITKQIKETELEIRQYCGDKEPQKEANIIQEEMDNIEKDYQQLKKQMEEYTQEKINLEKNQRGLEDTLKQSLEDQRELEKLLDHMLKENEFESLEKVIASFKPLEEREHLKNIISQYQEKERTVRENMKRLEKRMKGHSIEEDQWQAIQEERELANRYLEDVKKEWIEKSAASKDMKKKLVVLEETLSKKQELEHTKGLLDELEKIFKGKKFVEYISTGQLKYIAKEASQELKKITRNRYALELDADGNFIMRDDFNGGVRRGTQTLSGGETFLTSLALALALSSHIQLKGKAPLEFFFLDEGFGTLDSDLLETVMDSLEKLHSDRLSVGLISHVEELKQRVPRKLIIDPAEAGVSGSRVILEKS